MRLDALGVALLLLLGGGSAGLCQSPERVSELPAEPEFQALVAAVAALREDAKSASAPPEEKAHLSAARERLRAWVESQLPNQLGFDVDAAPLVARLNDQIDRAALTRGGTHCQLTSDYFPETPPWERPCGELVPLEVRVEDDSRFFSLHTGFATLCGSTDAAYLYRWDGAAWSLIWQTEDEAPGRMRSILIASDDDGPERSAKRPPLVAVSTTRLGCQGAWGASTWRLWRAKPGEISPKPLLAENGFEYLGMTRGLSMSLTKERLLVEYRTRSIDVGVHNRAFVAHYQILPDGQGGDRIERIAPVALHPRDFVDEWLTRPWAEAKGWVDPKNLRTLASWHEKLHQDDVSGSYDDAAPRCRFDPTSWQVCVILDPYGKKPSPPLYFRIRWLPPYRFTLLDIGLHPIRGCDLDDPMPDALDTLFP